MTSTFRCSLLLFTLAVVSIGIANHLQSAPKRTYKRIKPDTSKVDSSPFFKDVFREGLVGSRPANLGSSGTAATPNPPVGGNPDPMPSGGGESGDGKWGAIVSAQTIEDEIKRTKLELDKDITTPTAFNGLGHKRCRKHFSILGMLFAITHEYNGDVRWKDDAATARDLFGKAGRGCKVATPASYNESKRRREDLQAMVNGSSIEAPTDPAAEVDWSLICERSQLMKRIEKSLAKLREYTSSDGSFKSSKDEAKHEAEMLAAISVAMQQNGMPDGDDSDYAEFCNAMKDAAREIIDATKLGNVEPASSAVGNISQACDDCHEIYRG